MSQHTRDADGTAAHGICDSLLIALGDLKVLSEADTRGILDDVAAAHTEAAAASLTPEKHQAVVAIVQRIVAGKNGVPHPAVPTS